MVGRFGKLALAIIAGTLVVGVVLTLRLASQPPPLFPLPAAPQADAAPVDPNDPGGPTHAELQASLKDGREQEAAPMARWPGVARRQGDVLTIAAGGQDLASFTDAGYCDGFDQCSRWRFGGVLTLGGKPYPWLTLFQGEGWDVAYFVTPGGGLIGAAGDPIVSPDGRWMVVTYDNGDMGGGMTVFEIRPEGPIEVAETDLACTAGKWGAGDLPLTCKLDDARSVKARLVRRSAGWSVLPTAELDGAGKRVLAKPTAALVEIAIPATEAKNDGEGAAYELRKGYRKLAKAG